MSIFDNVKELVDYDYTLEEAKQELYGRASENIIEICYERLQEMKLQKERIERNIGKADRTPGKQNPKMHSRDMNIPFWELLYREGRDEINTIIKTFGTSLAAKYFRVDRKVILALRQHFNYQLVPGDWKKHCTYIPEEVRRSVDKRDNRRCIRCNGKLNSEAGRFKAKCIHYHKINHPGPLNRSNVATLCSICRRRIRSQNKGKDTFEGMQFKDFKKWIEDNDPSQKKK